jgi:hypothetical protein
MNVRVDVPDNPGRCRCRIYFATWKFRVGQAVMLGDMAAIILFRHRTAMGREMYDIWIGGHCDGRPFRTVIGSALK